MIEYYIGNEKVEQFLEIPKNYPDEAWEKYFDTDKNETVINKKYDKQKSADYIKEINNSKARNSRKSKYPSIEDQLDYIYKNGIEAWKKDVIKPIKDEFPIL